MIKRTNGGERRGKKENSRRERSEGETEGVMQPGSDYIITPWDLKEGLRRKKNHQEVRKKPHKAAESRQEREKIRELSKTRKFIQNSEEPPRRSLQAPVGRFQQEPPEKDHA